MMSILEHTQHIRVGSGGVMLPHYSPYKVAEQFKIMEARHPNVSIWLSGVRQALKMLMKH